MFYKCSFIFNTLYALVENNPYGDAGAITIYIGDNYFEMESMYQKYKRKYPSADFDIIELVDKQLT